MRRGIFSLLLLVMLVMGLCLPAQAQQVVGTWLSTSGGSWSVGTNWVSGTVPGSHAGDTANLAANITATTTVTLDQNETVGTLNIGDLDETNKYTLAPAAAQILTLDNGGNAATANLTQFGTSGGDTISVPLSLNSNLLLSNLAGGSNAQLMTLSGPINGASITQSLAINPVGSITVSGILGSNIGNITVGGGTGIVTLSSTANAFTGAVSVATGAQLLLSGSSAMSSMTLNGGYLNLNIANAGVLGSGPLTINGGAINANVGAIPALNVSSQNWNNNWTFNGSNNLNMGSGAVTLGTNIVVNSANNNATLTIGGNIGDGGHNYGLTLTNAYGGTTTLAGNNTYSGPTSLIGDGGTFNFLGSNATSGITVNGVNLSLGLSTTAANAAVLGPGTLTVMQGSTISSPYNGALTLSTNNNQTWGGNFTFNLSAALNMGSGTVTLTGNRTIYGTGGLGNALTVGGISDGGNNYSLTTQGNTNLHITQASTYTGGTVINNGANAPGLTGNPNLSLDFDAAGAPSADILAHGSALTMNNAQMAVNGAASGASSQTLGGFTFNGSDFIQMNLIGGGTNLILPNTWTRGSGATVMFQLSSTLDVISSAPIASNPGQSSTTPILPYGYVYGTNGAFGFGTVVNNQVVQYTAAVPFLAGTGIQPTTNFSYASGGTLTLGGATSVNSLSLGNGAGSTLDLGGNTLSLTSGGLISINGNTTVQDGTLTAGAGNELILGNFNNTLTVSAAINGNAALTTAGVSAVVISGNITNTPIVNLSTQGATTVSGTMTGVSTLNVNTAVSNVTVGAMNGLGASLTINNLNQAQHGPVFNGLITGNGSTALTINNNVAFSTQNGGPTLTFSGGITGVQTINYNTPNANILFLGNLSGNSGSLLISGPTAVTGLSALNLSDYVSNTISAPLTAGANFAVTETNAGYLTISGGITGNGSTALSFRGPNLWIGNNGNGTFTGNTISTGAIGSVASISNDGGAALTISSAINDSGANLGLANSSFGPMKITGVITATNLNITGGNGTHAVWYASNNIGGGQGLGDELILSPTAANALSGNTSVTDAMLYLDYTTLNVAKISTGALSLSSAALAVNNSVNATPAVASTTIGAGQSQVELYQGTGNLTLGTVSNANFGTANIFTGTPGAGSVIKVSGGTGGLIGGWATIGTDFAAIGTGGVVTAPGANGVPAYVGLTAGATGLTSTSNAQYASSTTLSMTAAVTANAWQINNTGNAGTGDLAINLNANNVSLASGGLLYFNSNAGGNCTITGSGGSTIYGDASASGNSPLYVTVDPMPTGYGTAPSLLTISAALVGGGSGTLVKTGYGELIATASAGYTGGTVINGGILRADGNALSTGPLTLNSGGAYATFGTFTSSFGTAAGQVSFGPGGGGFSAEGGNLTVNLGGASATVNASQLGGNLVVGSHVWSLGVLTFQNPIFMNEPLTISTSTFPDSSVLGTQSNLGTAYAKLSGGISGAGGLTIFGVGCHNTNAPNNTYALSSGMVDVSGGINVTGPITISGAGLYVPSMAALANNNVELNGGGVIATSGTANVTWGAAPGQVQFMGGVLSGGGGGGFAAVGGPLVVHANNDQAGSFRDDAGLEFNAAIALTLGSAFSTSYVDYQSPLTMAAGYISVSVAGPVPNLLSGQIIGGKSTDTLTVNGSGILVVSNSGNNFAGPVNVTGGAMLRPGSAGALGIPVAGSSYSILGTLDLNGYSFSGRNWSNFGGNGDGPLLLPDLINTSATPATFGSAADSYYVSNGNGNGAIGGPGNITLPGKFVGAVTSAANYIFKGTGTVTISGDTNGVTFGGVSQSYSEQVNGMTLVWSYASDTGNKALAGVSGNSVPASTTGQEFLMNSAALQLQGNASTAVSQNLPIIGGDYLTARSAGTSSPRQVGIELNGGFNTVNLTTAGANLTLNYGGFFRNNALSSIDFSTNTTAGGTAGINMGTSGFTPPNDTSLPVLSGGGGYSINQTSLPITISPPNTPGGVQAIGHAVTNAAGAVTAVYMDNWGSGYTANPTITISGGTTAANVALYVNHPVDNIIGGFATVNGSDWAYRDPGTGNIVALPSNFYTVQDDPSSWTANQNISVDANGPGPLAVPASVAISTLKFTGSGSTFANSTVNIGSGQTMTLGYSSTNAEYMSGGILVTSAVGSNNLTISGGNVATADGNDALFIHQNNPSGTLTINSAITSGGNSGLVKDGAGTLILTSVASSYNGATMIAGGLLQVPSLANQGTNSPLGHNSITIQGGATLQVNAPVSTATNRIITLGIGGGALDASGAGTVTFNGTANTRLDTDFYTEAVLGDGYSNFTLTGNGNGVMNGSILLNIPPQSAGLYGGSATGGAANAAVVQGFTQVTKTGTGTWTLSNYNYWQGGTVINQGTLVLNFNPAANYLTGPATSGVNVVANVNYADAISENAPVEIDTGGTLQLNYPEVTGQVNLYGGSITGTAALWGRAYNFQAGTVSASVPLVGDFSLLTKSTTGTITLSGSNTYAAGTVLNAGTININNAGNATSSAIGTGPLTLNGGSFDNTSGTIALATNNAQNWNGSFTFLGSTSLSDSGAVTLGGNPTVTVSGNTLTVGSIGDGGQGYGFTKAGSGTLTLTAPATYSGATTVNGGVLAPIASNLLSASSNVYVGTNSSAGTLDVTSGVQTVNSLTIGSLGALNETTGNPLTINGAASLASSSTLNMSGAIVTPELLMTYGAAGLTGSFSNIFTNGNPLPRNEVLSYSGGSVEVISIALPFTGSGVWVSNSGATWNNSANWLDAYSVSGVPGDGTRPGNTDTATFSGSGTIAGTITLDTTASINLAALSFSTSNYTLSGGSLTLQQGTTGSGTATVTVTSGSQAIQSLVQIAGGNLAIALSNSGILAISGNISDDGSQRSLTLAGDGSGQLVLSGTNNYGGATNVNAGAMYITNASALPPESNLTIGAGGTFVFDPNGPGDNVATSSPASAGAIAAVPEPGTLALLAAGLVVGFGVWRRRKGSSGVRS